MATRRLALVVVISALAAAQYSPSGSDSYGPGDTGSGGSSGYGGPQTSQGLDQGGSTNGGESSGGSIGGGSSYGSESYGPQSGERLFGEHLVLAHGVLASLAMVIFFPAGAITIRSLPVRFVVWLHIAWQLLGYILFVCAFGIGVYMARKVNFGSFTLISEYHPVIGIVVFSFISLQPILGVLHHVFFKTYQKRTIWSHSHIWLGRIAVTLGIINGGLGLRFADNASSGQEIAYGVVAALIWCVWMGAAVFGEIKRLKGPQGPPAYKEHADSNEELPRNDYYAKEGTVP